MANTIQDKLTYLSGTKEAIKQSIVAKGVDVADTDTFRSYADKINSIQAGGGGTVNIPNGTKFGSSIFTTVSTELFPYLESQNTMHNMFNNCVSLQTVPLFDTRQVNNMRYMFIACGSLQNVPLFDTSNVVDMSYMFSSCRSLQNVPLFDTRQVNNMTGMFSYCTYLTSIPAFNTSKVVTMNAMFSGCTSLTSVPKLNTANMTDTDSMFWDCTALTSLGGFIGLKVDLDLESSPLLTTDSVMNVITAAADMTSEPKTLILHQDAFNKLSEEQIATATAKGWDIAAA